MSLLPTTDSPPPAPRTPSSGAISDELLHSWYALNDSIHPYWNNIVALDRGARPSQPPPAVRKRVVACLMEIAVLLLTWLKERRQYHEDEVSAQFARQLVHDALSALDQYALSRFKVHVPFDLSKHPVHAIGLIGLYRGASLLRASTTAVWGRIEDVGWLLTDPCVERAAAATFEAGFFQNPGRTSRPAARRASSRRTAA